MCEEEDEKEEIETDPTWQDDIENREYYYDDASGYEIYIDEDDEDD